MAFPCVNDELGWHTQRLQSVPEFIGLRGGTLGITLAGDNQGRGLYLFNVTNRWTFLVHPGIIINGWTEERNHPLVDQVLAIITLPVGNAGTCYCCLKTIRLRNCPHRHVAAVAPAGHSKTNGIDRMFRDGGIYSGKYVAKVASTKIFYVSAGEIFALTIASPRVRKQNVVTARRKSGNDRPRHSEWSRPLRRRHAGGSAVNQNGHRIFFTSLHLPGGKKPTLNFESFVTPLQTPCFAPARRQMSIVSR